MKLGAIFPMPLGNDPFVIRDFVQTIEGLGYDYILTYEQIVDSSLNANAPTWQEPLLLLSYIAALTDKLELATGITVLASRQTVLAAKQVAQLDRLCGGRLRYGVATGWHQAEFQAMGIGYEARGKRLDEQIMLLRQLWAESYVTFSGDFHTLENVGIFPKPIQQRLPIWIGGYTDTVLKRVATLGDGWMVNKETPATLPAKLDTIKRYAEAVGRNPDDIGLEIVDMKLDEERDWAKWVHDFEAVGVGYMSVTTRYAQLATPQQHFDLIAKFIKAVR